MNYSPPDPPSRRLDICARVRRLGDDGCVYVYEYECWYGHQRGYLPECDSSRGFGKDSVDLVGRSNCVDHISVDDGG